MVCYTLRIRLELLNNHKERHMSTETARRWYPIWPGVDRTTLVSGDTMMQMLVTLKDGSRVAEHKHPEEQISYVVSGRLRFYVDGVAQELGPGESIYVPSNVVHAVDALEESLALDTFSPPRQDLLAIDRAG
jgi:quercetin dioxygenase-like cupin family protein